MKTIWKYTIAPDELQIQVPKESTVLFVGNQFEEARIWFLVDPAREKEPRMFRVYGTGHQVPDEPGAYVGSFMMAYGALVFHVFEVKG